MNQKTTIIYDNGTRKIVFDYNSNIWVTDVSGFSENDVDISESQGAGQIGSTITNMSVKPKSITINGLVHNDIETTRKHILACILPGVIAKLTVVQNGESWYLEGAPTKTPIFNDGEVIQAFQFSFKAAFPFWRTTAENVTSIAGLTPLFKTPFFTGGSFYISKYSESLYKNIINSGDSPIEIDVIFEALTPVLNPELYHIGSGSFIRLKREMQTGERFEVSTVYGRKGATLIYANNTTENGFQWLDADSNLFMTIAPGDNIFRYTADTAREGLRVTIKSPKGVKSGI